MRELHHLGLEADAVPPAVLVVTGSLAGRLPVEWAAGTVVARREYRSGRPAGAPDVLVCLGARGAPSAVIALEELFRAGARAAAVLTSCECLGCGDDDRPAHGLVVPRGAARDERTSSAYAPVDFPAVPDHRLALGLVDRIGAERTTVVRTVDVPPRWHPQPPTDDRPVDLESAAVLVAAAAAGVPAATVVVGRAASTAGLVDRCAQALRDRCA